MSHRVLGPASLSNLGPGFDTLGLCIEAEGETLGDVVEAEVDAGGVPGSVRVLEIVGDGGALSLVTEENTAAVAAREVLGLAASRGLSAPGLVLRIEKGIPLGSGVGGSSASAVAGAWAANLALGQPFEKAELVDAVLTGEVVASGSRHGDNVLPALLGGLVLTSASAPEHHRAIPLPASLPSIALLLPEVRVLTSEARRILPQHVPLSDAIANASDLAFLLEAFRAGDYAEAGSCMMRDRLVEPVRAELVPCYAAAKSAALQAGAYGCALTGSGPAMFALCADDDAARHVAAAMREASLAIGIEARALVANPDLRGVRAA